jgi:hypothetical protein
VKDGFEDDRTRVVPVPVISTTPSGPVQEPKTPPNAADATIRAVPPAAVPHTPPRLGIKDLFATSWGVRVLGQGALLACVVFLITVVPMLNWFSGALGHGVSTDLLARMLAFPLLASVVAGLMVASLIARTTARGLDRDDQSQA